MLQRPSAGDRTVAIPEARTDESFIEIEALDKTFIGQDGEAVVALEGLDLNVRRGEFVTIVGPSGCGKSTLLSLVAGLLEATAGEIRIGGTPIVEPYTDLGFVFQNDLLLDWRTVTGNVLLPCVMRGHRRGGPCSGARASCSPRSGLEGFEGKRPFELSGGMRPARRAVPRPAARPADAADGRAVRRARRADPRADAGRPPDHLAPHPEDRAVRHPFDLGGGVPVGPGDRDDAAPRRHPRDPRRRARTTARSQRARHAPPSPASSTGSG